MQHSSAQQGVGFNGSATTVQMQRGSRAGLASAGSVVTACVQYWAGCDAGFMPQCSDCGAGVAVCYPAVHCGSRVDKMHSLCGGQDRGLLSKAGVALILVLL